MILFDIIKDLEQNEASHLGRILILIHEFSGHNKKGEIEGLTKLAKLDFLLRYPVYLEKALKVEGKNRSIVKVQNHERKSVETRMVRFKYGPWDFRYRKFINTLVGLGYVYIRLNGRAYNIGITEEGEKVAFRILNDSHFSDIDERAKIIKKNFNKSGSNLMKFIYKNFPEIGTLQYGNEIK
jgi:hypothetical protein